MGILTALLAALAMCPLIFANVIGGACCCFTCPSCTNAKRRLQLEVSGVVDDGCTDCDDEANGIFILEYNAVRSVLSGNCIWTSPNFAGGLCGGPVAGDFTDLWLLDAKGGTQPSGGSFSHTLVLVSRDAADVATLQTPNYGLTSPTNCAYDPDDPDFDFTFYVDDLGPGIGCDLSAVAVSVSVL